MSSRLFSMLLGTLFLTTLSSAETVERGGHVKYQFSYLDEAENDIPLLDSAGSEGSHGVDFRLKTEEQFEALRFALHYELLALRPVRLQAEPYNDQVAILDLSSDIGEDDEISARNRIDRLWANYATESFVVRAGRDAITWGNGLTFQVLDLYNPFGITEIDKDYKTGQDLLYAQWLYSSGADTQLLIVPRRDVATNSIESNSSSYAVKHRFRYARVDIDLLGSMHYDEKVFGGGVAVSAAEAVFRLDLSVVDLADGDQVMSLVSNIDRSWIFFGKNMYGFIEYFFNGLGETPERYTSLERDLATRLVRGELFTIGRNYLTVGLRLELTPLLNLYQNTIHNLQDESGFYQLRFAYDITENALLLSGFNLAFGPSDSEFKGSADAGVITRRDSAYIRVSYYF